MKSHFGRGQMTTFNMNMTRYNMKTFSFFWNDKSLTGRPGPILISYWPLRETDASMKHKWDHLLVLFSSGWTKAKVKKEVTLKARDKRTIKVWNTTERADGDEDDLEKGVKTREHKQKVYEKQLSGAAQHLAAIQQNSCSATNLSRSSQWGTGK